MAKKLGTKAHRILRGNATIILAFYEIGNFVWKECKLMGRAGLDETLRAAEDFVSVLELMDVLCPDIQEDLPGICELAMRTGLTFYDASYLYMALRGGLVLITEDIELTEKARALGVGVLTVDELIRGEGLKEG